MNDNENDENKNNMACERHDIETLPSGYDRCPLCSEERRIQEREMHKITRDPTLEPW